jgi:hypothetical protein
MSIKTLRKRIALVAVASLGLGLVATVPASAATTTVVSSYACSPSASCTYPSAAATTDVGTAVSVEGVISTTGATATEYLTYTIGVASGTLDPVAADNTDAATGKVKFVTGSEQAVTNWTLSSTSATVRKDLIGATPGNAAAKKRFKVSVNPGEIGDYAINLTVKSYTAANATVEADWQTLTFYVHAGPQTTTVSTTAGANTYSTVLPTSRPNVAGVYTAKFNVSTVAGTGTPTIPVKSVISSKPAGSRATVTLASNSATNDGFDTTAVSGGGTATLVYTETTATTVSAAAGTLQSDVTFVPDLAGSYTIVTWTDLNNDGAIDANEGYATKTIVIAAEATVMSVTALNALGATGAGADKGALVKISLTNGALATTLAGTEVLSLSLSGATGTTNIQAPGATAAIASLTRTSFDKNGVVYLNITDTTADVAVLSVSGLIGGVAVAQTVSLEWVVPTTVGTKAATTAVSNTTGVKSTLADDSAAGTGAVTGNVFVDSTKSTTIGYTFTGAATASTTAYGPGEYLAVKVTDGSDGILLGKALMAYTTVVKFGTTGVASFSISVPSASAVYATAPAIGAPITVGTVLFSANTANTQTIKTVPAGNNSMTVTQSTFRVVSGGTVAASLTVKDQFGVARALQPITVSLNAGSRNSGAAGGATQYLITDANGVASWTYTDGPLTANATLISDTWTAASTGTNATSLANNGGSYASNSSAITASFVAAITVGSVAIDTPDTTAGVANTVKATPSAINAGSSGASASVVAISATVTDANGSVYSGIPVVFTVAGTGAAIPSNAVTAYTNNSGVASSSIYGWKAGTYTITATAGGKTSTGTITFASTTDTNARIVTATVNGPVVTANVVDRFGNPVKGVTIYATKTGAGYFGTGLSTASNTTDAAGNVEFALAGGEATVTVSAVNPTSAAGTTFGQTCAAKGYTSCATTATALLAPVAGTVTTAEKYVGNDIAPAGVASATVTVGASDTAAQAAADAAAEATDAANAATDAANAAAEAADAATAAAQDAADAVAALSTQVTEMVSALKKQITALTNLVIKIQKKVKA